MKRCIFCNNEFNELSEEHIIPNVICGRIKSKNLICKDCNSWLGREIDNALDGVYSHIINMFAIKRERGEGQPALVECVKDGKKYKYLANGDYELADTHLKENIMDDGKIEIKLQGPVNKKIIKSKIGKYFASEKEKLKQKGISYKDIIKKYHDYVDDNWTEIVNKTTSFRPDLIKFENAFGGKDIALAVLKILFFFIKETKPFININNEAIINILKEKSDKIWDRCFYYTLKEKLFNECESEISHFICIRGLKADKKIIGYIKLFSLTPYVCILDDNYEDEDFCISYGYNLISQRTCSPACNEITDLNNLKEKLDYKTNFDIASKNIEEDFSRIMDLYYKLNPRNKWTEIQHEVDKKIREFVGDEIAETPRFQSAIELLDHGENFHFTEAVTEDVKNEIVVQLANIIITQISQDCIQQYYNSFK